LGPNKRISSAVVSLVTGAGSICTGWVMAVLDRTRESRSFGGCDAPAWTWQLSA